MGAVFPSLPFLFLYLEAMGCLRESILVNGTNDLKKIAQEKLAAFDFMDPYYKKDIDAGKPIKGNAQELLKCLFLKLNEHQLFTDIGTASLLPGSAVFKNLQVGGMNKYGRDATNELSYLCIDALIEIRTVQPALSVRLHERSPEKFR